MKDIRKVLAEKFPHSTEVYKFNYLNIPITWLTPTEENVELFNEVYAFCLEQLGNGRKFTRTRSGGISISRENYSFYREMWDVQTTSSTIELTLKLSTGNFRIKVSNVVKSDITEYDEDGNSIMIGGRTSFKVWAKVFDRFGIDIKDYASDAGEERRAEIEKPMIYAPDVSVFGETIEGAHHLDVNSAFAAGIAEDFPELSEAIKWMYNRRNENKNYKSYLVAAIGYFQSRFCKFKYADLSKHARNNCNKYIRDLATKLENNGRKILLYNTDGIWYSGEMYHDENEGHELGQWKNDHKNCKLRIKSHGAYEYIEKIINEEGVEVEKYKPVVRGRTILDRYLPREQWEWGDIYRGDASLVEKLCFVEGAGIITTKERI